MAEGNLPPFLRDISTNLGPAAAAQAPIRPGLGVGLHDQGEGTCMREEIKGGCVGISLWGWVCVCVVGGGGGVEELGKGEPYAKLSTFYV